MAAVFASDELNILGYNRTLKANGLSGSDILKKIEEAGFSIEKLSKGEFPSEKRSFSMYLDNAWYKQFSRAALPEPGCASSIISG